MEVDRFNMSELTVQQSSQEALAVVNRSLKGDGRSGRKMHGLDAGGGCASQSGAMRAGRGGGEKGVRSATH